MQFTVPPTDAEKYNYLKGPQHRWFFWAHFAAFIGVVYSLYGFARMQYWTLIFLVPLALYSGETLLGLRTSTYRRRISLADHQAVVELWRPLRFPSVDIMITTCGEDLDTLENTFRYTGTIDYPGRWTVYVLDDAGRPEVARLAAAHGFEYVARPGSEFKKAGNLQYSFERTDGEHILILDADFVPRSDFLVETIPYMDDPEIGIIQTPQYYPSTKGLGWLERCAAATQEVFYRFVQPSRDVVNATICCGTSAIYRRSALAAIGGFPLIGHSEDLFTGFEMSKYGYRIAFVPIIVSQGLCPDRIDPYISQQYRWCEGSMQLLREPSFHLHPAITSRQRASYWSGFFYYITTAMNGFFAPVPLLLMVWMYPQWVRPVNMLPLIGLPILWLILYPAVMRHRWRLDVLRVQIIYGFTHAVAIYDMFAGSLVDWVPSNDGVNRATPLAVKVKRIMGSYLALMYVAILAVTAERLTTGYSLRQWWALLAFIGLNLYVFVPVVWVSLSTLYVDARAARQARGTAGAERITREARVSGQVHAGLGEPAGTAAVPTAPVVSGID